MDKAMTILVDWVTKYSWPGVKHQVLKEPKRTPLLVIEIEGSEDYRSEKTVIMYGHMDKVTNLDKFYYFLKIKLKSNPLLILPSGEQDFIHKSLSLRMESFTEEEEQMMDTLCSRRFYL